MYTHKENHTKAYNQILKTDDKKENLKNNQKDIFHVKEQRCDLRLLIRHYAIQKTIEHHF